LINLYMTSIEIKTEIQKVLDQVPENVLGDVLDFLKELQSKSPDQIKLANNLRKILSEDRELLEKLAQ
jgi:mRNA-degrading endonuclease RelE of RelBE toxin-antitoxin system